MLAHLQVCGCELVTLHANHHNHICKTEVFYTSMPDAQRPFHRSTATWQIHSCNGRFYETNPMQSYLSGLCAIVSNCKQRFTTRSFFLAPVEQSHVNRVVEKLGGPELQARQFLQISEVFGRHRFFLYIKTACVAMQVSRTKRKSLTISWGKHGGLRKSFGSQLHFLHDQIDDHIG